MIRMRRAGSLATVVLTGLGLLWAGPSRAACDDDAREANAAAGAVIGAVIGGLLGSAIGKGDGRRIAIGAGVIAGGLVGHRIGTELGCPDGDDHARSGQRSLEHGASAAAALGPNPRGASRGLRTPAGSWRRADGVRCRELEQRILTGGSRERRSGRACWDADGVRRPAALPGS